MNDRNTWFWEARRRHSTSNSCSVRPAGNPSGCRIRIGVGMTSSMNASRAGAPTTFNISSTSRSSGPMWRFENWSTGGSLIKDGPPEGSGSGGSLRVFLQELLVRFGVHQILDLLGLAQLDLDHPALVVGLFVHVLR